jgi:hypothetical protein
VCTRAWLLTATPHIQLSNLVSAPGACHTARQACNKKVMSSLGFQEEP